MAQPDTDNERSNIPRPVLEHRRASIGGVRLWPHKSIRARLQLSHLITSLLPLLILGFVLLYTTFQSERRAVEQIQLSVARSVATDIGDSILQVEHDLTAFARQVPMDTDGSQIREMAEGYVARRAPGIADLAILDLDGNEVVRVTPSYAYVAGELRNRRGEPFFAMARQGRPHRTIVQSERGRYFLQIAVPIRNSVRRITGVLLAQSTTQHLERRLSALPQNTGRSAFLVDEIGNVLLGQPPGALRGTDMLARWARTSTLLTTLNGKDGEAITAARTQTQTVPWFVIVEQRSDVAFSSQWRSTWLLVLMLILTASVVVVWGIVIGREMTRPILQLRDGVQTLGAGQLGGTIVVSRDDELGQLAHEFNRMSERLAESQHEVEQRNMRLAESQRAIEQQNVRLREGLDLAQQVQRDLLPQGPPKGAPIVAHAASQAATEIGGDFYTYVPLPDGRLRLIIGDASGKGVAAALVMALTSSLVEIHARQAVGPGELLNRLSTELFPRFMANHMCVALLVAEFDPHGRQLCVANAGMIAPLLIAEGRCSYIPAYGAPLGVVYGATYSATTVDLAADQFVVLISDGIIEARSPDDKMWGFERFEATVCATSDGVEGIVAKVLHAVRRHVVDRDLFDDMTIIAASLVPAQPDTDELDLVILGEGQEIET